MSQDDGDDNYRVRTEDEFTKCAKKMAELYEPKQLQPKPKPIKQQKRTNYYLTCGRKVDLSLVEQYNQKNKSPFQLSADAIDEEYVKEFRRTQQELQKLDRKKSYLNHDNYNSRLRKYKPERLHVVPEVSRLPGKSLAEDIDPEYFTIVEGRPTKGKKDIRAYYKDVRSCFLTRLQTGFLRDEILLIEEQQIDEIKKLEEIKVKYKTYIDSFEEFLAQDHSSSVELLKLAESEVGKSKEKGEAVALLESELNEHKSKLLILEEQWRTCRMFQKFLYRVSPIKWRRKHDRAFKMDKHLRRAEQDMTKFVRTRGPSLTMGDPLDVKLYHFKGEIASSLPPSLYFKEPRQLQDIFLELERTNLLALLHSQHLTPPAIAASKDLVLARSQFEKEQKILKDEIAEMKELIESEESKGEQYKEKTKEICFGVWKELCTNEEMLTITAFVEDVYEDAIAPTDGDVSLVEMVRQIELEHETLLLALDTAPNQIVVDATRSFYIEEEKTMKEANAASRKVHQMEILLKRLGMSLRYPKKGPRLRRLLFRSEPPEEAMEKFEPPKVLTKEEAEHQYFFEKHCRDPADCQIYRPLCG